MTTKIDEYAVMWTMHRGLDTQVFTLTYGETVLTYAADHIEGMTLPRFTEAHEAFRWIQAHPGKMALVHVRAAQTIRPGAYAHSV